MLYYTGDGPQKDEKAAKEALSEMIKKYPSVVKQDNVNDVIAATLKKKRQM